MLMGRADSLSDLRSSKDHVLAEPISELYDDEGEDCPEQILYSASFYELASNCVRYDTVIWLSISILLVLAWGVGIIMLLYLPIRRYVLQKDLSSRKLYVTPTKIVYRVYKRFIWFLLFHYDFCKWKQRRNNFSSFSSLIKVSRPSFIPFWGIVNMEKEVPLSLVIDIIIEQGTDAGLPILFPAKSYIVFLLHTISSQIGRDYNTVLHFV